MSRRLYLFFLTALTVTTFIARWECFKGTEPRIDQANFATSVRGIVEANHAWPEKRPGQSFSQALLAGRRESATSDWPSDFQQPSIVLQPYSAFGFFGRLLSVLVLLCEPGVPEHPRNLPVSVSARVPAICSLWGF